MSRFRKIGILSSGGDAPGMNAAIRAAARRALSQGIEVVGILGGYSGLVNAADVDDKELIETMYLKPLRAETVSNIVTRGGTMLYSSRCPEFQTPEGMDKAIRTCQKYQIDAVIAIGGDGTFRGATDLTRHNIPSIGIPGTIDNDITATEQTIGFDTALNTALHMMDDLRDTAESHSRCIVTEVMGNGCGLLTLYTGIATGAISIAIPEVDFDIDNAIERIKRARNVHHKRGIMAVVSEHLPLTTTYTDENGSVIPFIENDKYSEYFARVIGNVTKIDTRHTRLGHIIRGGNPTLRDRLIATQMGVEAVNALLDNRSNCVVCVNENRMSTVDIQFALALDNMYKNKLGDNELEGFTAEQIADMKKRCEVRKSKIHKLYDMAYNIGM